MSGGGIENHWRLRGEGRIFNHPFFFFCFLFLSSYTGYGPLLI